MFFRRVTVPAVAAADVAKAANKPTKEWTPVFVFPFDFEESVGLTMTVLDPLEPVSVELFCP
ncbi:hypothetical protein [Faecalicoccus pleomorphus]|uniref:hypothetical protein n=1 Tax=Faecalicoccus pleomorphus TaxID=1323 RepID=UPI002432231B|nr:hypothetical protein [Faecalicoccus pleomorphus]